MIDVMEPTNRELLDAITDYATSTDAQIRELRDALVDFRLPLKTIGELRREVRGKRKRD